VVSSGWVNNGLVVWWTGGRTLGEQACGRQQSVGVAFLLAWVLVASGCTTGGRMPAGSLSSSGVSGAVTRDSQAARYYLVTASDFPRSGGSPVALSSDGSQLLQAAIERWPRMSTLLADRGLPLAVSVDGEYLYLAYISPGVLYTLGPRTEFARRVACGRNMATCPSFWLRSRELEGLEMAALEQASSGSLSPTADGVSHIKQLIRRAIPLQRVSRRLALVLPSHDDESLTESLPGKGWGFFFVPATPASREALGVESMTPGVVVAWVDPDGPAMGVLAAGDLLVGINGRRLTELPGFDISSLDRATFMVERGEGSRSIYVEAEAWPRDVNFFMIEYASPNAGPSQRGVVVSSSLLDLLEDEDQLAVVLGHELAHLLLGHAPEAGRSPGRGHVRAMTRGVNSRGNTARRNTGRRRMAGEADLAFDREVERRADLLGVDLAESAGYRGSAFARVMQLLEEAAGGRAHAFLDRHPDYPQRAMLVQHHLEDRAVAGQVGKGSL